METANPYLTSPLEMIINSPVAFMGMYYGKQAHVYDSGDDESFTEREIDSAVLGMVELDNIKVLPVLIPLENMTEEVALQLTVFSFSLGMPCLLQQKLHAFKNAYGDWVGSWDDKGKKNPRYCYRAQQTSNITFDYNHFQTLYLISKGYDIFRMIEKGKAVKA